MLVEQGRDCHADRRALVELLEERFEVEHTTLQVDHAHFDTDEPLSIQPAGTIVPPERGDHPEDHPIEA